MTLGKSSRPQRQVQPEPGAVVSRPPPYRLATSESEPAERGLSPLGIPISGGAGERGGQGERTRRGVALETAA